jgi:two-component system chemotaxis sensor kinase CheA
MGGGWSLNLALAEPTLAGGTAEAAKFTEWNQTFHTQLERRIITLSKVATQDARTAGALVDDLLEDAKKLVMLPFATLLDMFPKLVRDLARDEGKEVELVLRGRDVEIDKRILEEMKDPLIHLVRNSIDHGIEIPATRTAAGKVAQGSLTISVAQRQGGKVEIVVLDDGAGIDAPRVRASAVKTGLLSAEDAAQVDDNAAVQFIFHSGVSTSPVITEISGRGLGMAIVRDTVKKLGGQLTVGSRAGIGTSFRMLLPVTLAAFKGVLVEAGGQTFVIPTASIDRIVRVKREEIHTVEARTTITMDGHTVALAWLDAVLELSRKKRSNDGFIEVAVLGAGDERIGFAVDTVLNEQEVLVKNLGPPLLHVRNIAGAAVLASGVPVLILHVADLLKSAVRAADNGMATAITVTEEPARRRSILVVDDSLVSRMLLKNILESAGYDLATAVDGMDALTQLQTREFALVVSDVEMPRMDGFHLARRIRADKKLANLPIVLMTALASREHQECGIEAGANAYLLKKNFDHGDLLDVVQKLI